MNSVLNMQCALCIVHIYKYTDWVKKHFLFSPVYLFFFYSYSYKLYYIIESFFCWLTMFSFFYRFIPVKDTMASAVYRKNKKNLCFVKPKWILAVRYFYGCYVVYWFPWILKEQKSKKKRNRNKVRNVPKPSLFAWNSLVKAFTIRVFAQNWSHTYVSGRA